MDRVSLQVTPRTVLGKKVKQLRKQGVIPGHIFGYQTDPINVSVDNKLLEEVYKHSGDTGLVDLKLDEQTYPVLIQNIQVHAVTDAYLNIDFHKVNLKEKVTVAIPIVAAGEPKAVEEKIGILEQPVSEVEIEALPTDLIDEIEFDVSALAQIDDAVYVKDLKVPSTVTILADEEELVFKIGPLMTAEMEETLEAAEAAQAAEGEEGAEGEKPEGEEGKAAGEEARSEEGKEEPKAEE